MPRSPRVRRYPIDGARQDGGRVRAPARRRGAPTRPCQRSRAPRSRVEEAALKEWSPVSDVPVLVRPLDPDLPLPRYAHPGDAGADLYAAEDVELAPGERALVRTGLAIAL